MEWQKIVKNGRMVRYAIKKEYMKTFESLIIKIDLDNADGDPENPDNSR
jgi:hypothetical protein